MNTRNPYLDQPIEIAIETFAFCNAACTFCPYPTLERKGTRMSEDLMYRLLDEISKFEHPCVLSPFKVNEPLLDTRLMKYLNMVNLIAPSVSLRLFTNGSPLSASLIDRIAALDNVRHLWISLNSHNPDEYKKIMGLDFERTALRLDALHYAVFIGEFLHPVVLSKVVDNPDTWWEFTMYCNTRWPLFKVQPIKQDSWLGYAAPLMPDIPDAPCARWFELSILATGIVSLCCMDGKGEFPIGDVNTQTLLEVYNNPFYRERREQSLSRMHIHPCSTCSY